MARYSASRMKKHHIERMWKLIDALEAFEETETKKFDMGWFYFDASKYRGAFPSEYPSCGTACCAFGLAATVPSLKKAGLKLEYTENGAYSVRYDNRTTGETFSDFSAAEAFFNITENDATYLFGPDSYAVPTKKNVLRRLYAFVSRQEDLLNYR